MAEDLFTSWSIEVSFTHLKCCLVTNSPQAVSIGAILKLAAQLILTRGLVNGAASVDQVFPGSEDNMQPLILTNLVSNVFYSIVPTNYAL